MLEYKLYFLDSEGHVVRAKYLGCTGDAEAVRLVLNHPRHRAMELWQGAKRLRSFPADNEGLDGSSAYVIYFLRHEEVIGMTVFDAPTDIGACTMAEHIFHACNDACDAFEVWRGDHWVQAELQAQTGILSDAPPATAEALMAKLERRHQNLVVDREIRLQDSYAAIRRSRKLLDTIGKLKPLYGSFEAPSSH